MRHNLETRFDELNKINSTRRDNIQYCEKDDFDLKSLGKLFVDLKGRQILFNDRTKSSFDECVIFIVTKNGLKRMKETISQFAKISVKVVVLDDSTNGDTKKFIEKKIENTNINYHGREERKKFLRNFADLGGAKIECFLPNPSTAGWNLGCSRNYAIILSKVFGYKKLLMIDDDILINDLSIIRDTFNLLSQFDIVGTKTIGMPDDSIVGHIFRDVGIKQYDFISGQYAAFNLDSIRHPFPNVYNEDWITFLLESINLKLVRFSYIYQLPYDPFINGLSKCVFQEKGEIICDGVIDSIMVENINLLVKDDFWSKVIKQRIHNIIKLESRATKSPNYNRYKHIFTELKKYHLHVDPSIFSSFFIEYFNNIRYWTEFDYLVKEQNRG